MKNSFVFEINMWRWLLGVPLAAIATIVVFIGRSRYVWPFFVSIITLYLLTSELYIPHYYSAFDFSVNGRSIILTKGVIIKSQTIISLEGPLVFERVSPLPFSAFGVCLLILRARGVLITLPLIKADKVKKLVEAIENVQN